MSVMKKMIGKNDNPEHVMTVDDKIDNGKLCMHGKIFLQFVNIFSCPIRFVSLQSKEAKASKRKLPEKEW